MKIEIDIDEDTLDTFVNNCEANDLDKDKILERLISDFNNRFMTQIKKYLSNGCGR